MYLCGELDGLKKRLHDKDRILIFINLGLYFLNVFVSLFYIFSCAIVCNLFLFTNCLLVFNNI